MSNWKKSASISGENEINKIALTRLNSLDKESRDKAKGIAGDPLNEGVPQLIQTSTEKSITGNNNTCIVLGRDRPSTRLSGYGGAGHTQAGAIDIVVGRWGSMARSEIAGETAWVNPSFEHDAARIYISQKTDVDKNFQLAGAKIGESVGRSAIALKADGIRIIAREGIKLITKTDPSNSQGGSVDSVAGINLIAGNDDSNMQPMIKGNQMAAAMRALTDQLNSLNGIVDSILDAQMQMNMEVTHHFHYSPFFGLPTTPSPPVIAKGIKTTIDHLQNAKIGLMTQKTNLEKFKATYLCGSGQSEIRSKYHFLN
jgi:hypothetical protein